MAKNYENENKAKNYSTDKTSTKMQWTARTAPKTAQKCFQKQFKETKHPTHMTYEHR